MKSTLALILILSLYSLEVLAGPACNVELFKKQYVDLQNALRYEGQTIKLDKGKVKATGEESNDSDNSPGRKAEMALYKNYKAALGKVKKIYDYINANNATSEEKKILSNPEVTSFFKAINPDSTSTNKLNVNIETLLNTLKDKVPGKEFSLDQNDIYLLKKLLIHSQDRICTLDNYVASKKGTPATRVQYLEQLKNAPLNKMIESLRSMTGTEDVKLSNEEAAVMNSVKDQVDALHKMALNCKNQLNTLNLSMGETIQGCNYNHFIKSLTADEASYRPFEAILHFINANQNAKNARTNLNWLNNQLIKETIISCEVDPASKELFVKNFPFKNERVESSRFKCTKNDKEFSGETCLQGLKYEFVNGRGFKLSAIKGGIKTLSITDSSNCANVSLPLPAVASGPVAPTETDEQKCAKNDKKEWKDGKCLDKKIDPPAVSLPSKCNRDECGKLPGDFLKQWHSEGAFCYKGNIETDVAIAKTRAICNESGDLNQAAETEASCKEKKKILDPVNKKVCIDAPAVVAETEESCKKKKMDFDKEKNVCVTLTEEEQCKKQNDTWLDGGDKEEGVRTDRYIWKDKKCIDKQEKKTASKEEAADSAPAEKELVYPTKPVPGRFQPVNIPTRQVFILPGMP